MICLIFDLTKKLATFGMRMASCSIEYIESNTVYRLHQRGRFLYRFLIYYR